MAASHDTNYSYKNCSFCIINYFEISSTVIDTPKFLILVWVFVDDDDGDNEMIMYTKKNPDYMVLSGRL